MYFMKELFHIFENAKVFMGLGTMEGPELCFMSDYGFKKRNERKKESLWLLLYL